MAETIRRCLYCRRPFSSKATWQKFCNNEGDCRYKYHNAVYKAFRTYIKNDGTCPHCKLPIVFEGLHGEGKR